jgi:hypothetical protein
VENENSNRNDSVFSRKIRAGRRRTYFFDVRTTKANDYYLTITESKKRFDGNGYERHKLFIYKEDFNKFLSEMNEVVDHIKGLMPDFDFDAFAHKYDEQGDNYREYGGNDNYGERKDNYREEVPVNTNTDAPESSYDDHDNNSEENIEDDNDSPPTYGSKHLDDEDLKL